MDLVQIDLAIEEGAFAKANQPFGSLYARLKRPGGTAHLMGWWSDAACTASHAYDRPRCTAIAITVFRW